MSPGPASVISSRSLARILKIRPTRSVLPLVELKSCITGDGSADKRQMQDMLVRMLNLEEIPTPDDAADALGMAVYGALNTTVIPSGVER